MDQGVSCPLCLIMLVSSDIRYSMRFGNRQNRGPVWPTIIRACGMRGNLCTLVPNNHRMVGFIWYVLGSVNTI